MVSYASSTARLPRAAPPPRRAAREIAASEADIAALEREKARWEDSAYVSAQARERFGWVLPGEIGYQVIDEDGRPLGHDDSLSDATSSVDEERPEWWQAAWKSVEVAGNPPRPAQAQQPAERIRLPRQPGSMTGCASTRTMTRRWSAPSSAARPARSTASATAARVATPTWSPPSPGSPDGTPFPTTFYLTCPRAASLIGTLEASGLMKEMTDRLESDPTLAAPYGAAHERVSRRPRGDRPRPGDRRRLRRRHARPRQVPARARRPGARPGPRREPAGRRGGRARSASSGLAGPCTVAPVEGPS